MSALLSVALLIFQPFCMKQNERDKNQKCNVNIHCLSQIIVRCMCAGGCRDPCLKLVVCEHSSMGNQIALAEDQAS